MRWYSITTWLCLCIGGVATGQSFHSASLVGTQHPQLSGDTVSSTNQITVDGFLFFRTGIGDEFPLIFDDTSGAQLLGSNELDLEGELGGQVNIDVSNFHFTFFGTGEGLTREVRSADPANVTFFNAFAADPAPQYRARLESDLKFGDIGLRKQLGSSGSVYAAFAAGRLRENMDLLSSGNSGFFSDVENDLLGVHIGGRKQLLHTGNFHVEGAFMGGVYHNDIEVFGQALNAEQTWTDEDVTFSGLANLAVVIPAWPFDLRIGYQVLWMSGLATLPEASRTLSIFDPNGTINTDDVLYHGLIFGVEKRW